jgi:hypothetical protein
MRRIIKYVNGQLGGEGRMGAGLWVCVYLRGGLRDQYIRPHVVSWNIPVEHSRAWAGKERCRGMSVESIKRINGQLRGDGCKNVGLWECVETDALRRRSFGNCTRPTVTPSMDIDEAAVDKRFQMSREGTTRWDSGGGYNTSVDI